MVPKYVKDPRLRAVLAVVAFLLAGTTVVVTVDGGDPAGPAPTVTATPQVAPPPSDLNSDLRSESGISKADADANAGIGERAAERAAASRKPAVSMPKCIRDYRGEVWSSRAGSRPVMFVLHYTVSSNRPGWDDVRAVQQDFINRKNTSNAGSSTFIVDFEGHCLKMVPESQKPWTQGNANRYSISVEIIAKGSESRAEWRASPLMQKKILARLARNVMDRWGMRIRLVDPVGCLWPDGWDDHSRLECGNFHTDVLPNFPYGTFGRQLHSFR